MRFRPVKFGKSTTEELFKMAQLDFIFPFVLLAYGFLLIFIFESGLLTKVPNASFHRLSEKQSWAWVCFFVGGFWSLQNLLF